MPRGVRQLLNPSRLARLAQAERWEELEHEHVMDCMECGACTFTCPSGLPIVHLIRAAKAAYSAKEGARIMKRASVDPNLICCSSPRRSAVGRDDAEADGGCAHRPGAGGARGDLLLRPERGACHRGRHARRGVHRMPAGRSPRGSLFDGSAILTGVMLGLVPAAGDAHVDGVPRRRGGHRAGQGAFGGLGQNLFNPALVGRAFLQAAFPTAITTWSEQGHIGEFFTYRDTNFLLPFTGSNPEWYQNLLDGIFGAPVDAVTTATPLAFIKFGGEAAGLHNLLLGDTAGSLGETCALLIIIAGVILSIRRTFDWRIPVSILATVGVFSLIVWLINKENPSPIYMLCSGSLLFGAVYMATDPVTSPIAPRGAWIFGFGVGALVVLIRLWGGLPEGVMYAILLMNAATPLINRISEPRPLGRTLTGAPMS
jgi:electron transport complex protein RnfD